jgi:hypothetical protein
MLRGRDVVIVPDNDSVGRGHAQTIGNALTRAGCRVRILNLPGLPPKGDLSNWIAAGGTREALEALLAGDAAPEHVIAPEQQDATPAAPERPASGNPDWLQRTPTVEDIEPREIKLVWFRDMQPQLEDRSLVGGMLNKGSMGMLVGSSGTGKTFLALDMALHVAGGREWFGNPTQAMGAVYIATEAGDTIINRVIAYREHYSGVPADLPFAAVVTPVNLCDPAADIGSVIFEIKRAITDGVPIGLIIVDTLSRAMPGSDENSSEDMTNFIGNMDRLREQTGAHVLIVHHLGKDAGRGARGHSSLNAAVDTEITVERNDATKVSSARVTKQRDLPEMATPINYRRLVVELGRDQHDNPVTSCICEAVDGPIAAPKKQAPLTGAAKVGLDQLNNCMADQSEELPALSCIPAGARGVTLDQWQSRLAKAGVINMDGSYREQFKRIRVTLQERGFIGVWDEFVWLSHGVT